MTYWLIGIPLILGLVYYPLRQHQRLGDAEPLGAPVLAED